MTTPAPRHNWTDSDRKVLRTLWNENKTIRQISQAMGMTYGQIDRQIDRMKSSGLLISRTTVPAAVNKPKYSGIAPTALHFRPDAEAQMLQAVNAAGGFPLQRKIEISGKTFVVLTTLDPHTPHPFQLAQLAQLAKAAA